MHVVRGADLIASTPPQIYLQQRLNLPTPHYAHLPLELHSDGEKLSKQNGATALDIKQTAPTLLASLKFLRQALPDTNLNLEKLWECAISRRSRTSISLL